MAKAYRIPDYKKMYPEAKEEVINLLRTTERKMQYQEYDLKTEQTVINQEDQTITTIPSREDSLERLIEQEMQFAGESESVEETVLRRLRYGRAGNDTDRPGQDQYFPETGQRGACGADTQGSRIYERAVRGNRIHFCG